MMNLTLTCCLDHHRSSSALQTDVVISVHEAPDAFGLLLDNARCVHPLCALVLLAVGSHCETRMPVLGHGTPLESQVLRWVQPEISGCLDVDLVSQHPAMWLCPRNVQELQNHAWHRTTSSGGVELVVAAAPFGIVDVRRVSCATSLLRVFKSHCVNLVWPSQRVPYGARRRSSASEHGRVPTSSSLQRSPTPLFSRMSSPSPAYTSRYGGLLLATLPSFSRVCSQLAQTSK